MKLKLNNDGLKALYTYVKFLIGYLLSEKSKLRAPGIRTAEINCEFASLIEVERKIVNKQYKPNPGNKARTLGFKPHEAFTMVKYQRVYEASACCDKYIEHVAEYNFPVFWTGLLK